MADETYEGWFGRVNRWVLRIAGVGAEDLADQCWYDWFKDGITPKQAARLALENEGFPVEGGG